MKKDMSASDHLRRIYPEEGMNSEFSREVTFQLTENCNLACFVAGTKIKTVDGYKEIQDIVEGDKILGFNLIGDYEQEIVETTVTHIFQLNKPTIKISTANISVTTTAEHPFLLEGNVWIEAQNLTTEHEIIQTGGLDKITSIKAYKRESVVYNLETECHTFIANEFLVHNCTYCYQGCKSGERMTWETGKKIVDWLYMMWDKNDPNGFINQNTKMIILDFIGGEPMLEVELMDKIVSYFWTTAIERRHPWADTYMISIATNGTQHFKPAVQNFIYKYKGHLSYGVSIDGPKEMHDACRIHHDGRGSFDEAYAAQKDFNEHFYESSGTKATIARANLPYLSKLIRYYVEQGYDQVHANYVYEEDWNFEDANLLYNQMKDIADYILSLDHEVEIALFDDRFFAPMDENDNNNWCWGAGTPILTAEGYVPIENIKVGDLVLTHDGSYKPVINTMSHFANNCVEIKGSGILPMVCTNNHKVFGKLFKYIGNKGKKHYSDYDRYSISEYIKPKDLIQVSTITFGNKSIDSHLAYLLGRFIGDGWMTASNIPAICCGFDEETELEELFKAANIQYTKTRSATTLDFYATIKENIDNINYNIFKNLCSDCGHGASNKHFPRELFLCDMQTIQSTIAGYISADGHRNTIKNNACIACGTSSYRLANELMLLLRSMGYFPTCSRASIVDTEIIFGRKVNRHPFYDVYWFENKKTRYYKIIDGKLFSARISTKPVQNQLVYNITVEDNHSYVAGSIVSSNCGGTGAMLAFDPKGDAFPCIRYMNSSLNGSQVPLKIGSVDEGIYETDDAKQKREMLESITRRSQSTDECFYCPIASGCSWCSGWNYQEFGTPNKRSTRICPMHKARSLANVYFWNKKHIKEGSSERFIRHLPDEDALKIIDQKELDLLNLLEKS